MVQQAPEQSVRLWWQKPLNWAGGGAVVVLVVVLLLVVLLPPGNGLQPVSTPTKVPAAVLTAVTDPGLHSFATVGEGGQPGELSRLTGTKPLTDSAGKTEVIYVGAEYCPYCAAERWSLIMALSRFGTFTGLKETSSSSSDVDPNTSSFTFVDSSYTSQWVDFTPVEEEDQNQNPLQTPSAAVEQIFTTYNQQPYTASAAGEPGLPFLDIGGVYVLYQTGFDPAILQGLSWKQIAADLGNLDSPVTRAIVGNANWLTAAVCLADHTQPSSVCGSATIQGIETVLTSQSTVGS
jgi:thiol-disulfide isomerase/thioredoxin